MPQVIWTIPALEDAQRLFQFLKEKNPDAARKAALRIKAAGDILQENPRIGKLMSADTARRELPAAFGKRGYVLRYYLDEAENPVIISVWHIWENR